MPIAQGQAPGWYRMLRGSFQVTALSDATVKLPVDPLRTGIKAARVESLLLRAYLKAPVEASVNGYLIHTGAKQADEVYTTHMHPDPVGGLMADGKMVFTNAVVRADLREGNFWLSQANLDKAPADGKGLFQGAMASLDAYVAAGKLKPFDGETGLLPGIRARRAATRRATRSMRWKATATTPSSEAT